MSNRKVVAELSKLWESVARKTRQTQDPVSWVNSPHPILTTVQRKFNEKYEQLSKFPRDLKPEDVAERTKQKVNRLLTVYEETIGISEVRSAHARVLSTEAKFIDCQEKRRLASKELSLLHSKLMEIRAELDRTQRGDDSYLDLIKQEISATKEERFVRRQFEELERTEREVFSELSSALRFSHEKERAQNEKTKYWSIVGSIIGAALGVLGTTINNRMKQNHIRTIQEQTSTQVAAILTSVDQLSEKLNEITSTAVMSRGPKLNEMELGALANNMKDWMSTLKEVLSHATCLHKPILERPPGYQPPYTNDNWSTQISQHKWQVGAVVGGIAATIIAYKFL